MAVDTSSPAAAVDLIVGARKILDGTHRIPLRQRTRAAAVLARCALEAYVERYLGAHQAGFDNLEGMSQRVRFICFTATAPQETVTDATWAWWTLSGLCHQHAYELTPTHAEVAHLIDRVEAVIRA